MPKRTIKVGTIDRMGVFVDIEVKETDKGPELSISAELRRSGHGVMFGQCRDEVKAVALRGTPIMPRREILRMVDIWERWHMNGMQAGCEHQRALGWNSYDEHPSEPCPTCGYKYGTAWLYEPLPQDVIDWAQEVA